MDGRLLFGLEGFLDGGGGSGCGSFIFVVCFVGGTQDMGEIVEVGFDEIY